MARTKVPTPCQPPRRADINPESIKFTYYDQTKHGYAWIEHDFSFVQTDSETLVMVPSCYHGGGYDRQCDCEWYDGTSQSRCWKTCVAYELINEKHPRLAEYIGRDARINLPLFKVTSGPDLDSFLECCKSLFYSPTSPYRPDPQYLPLFYQWILQLLSAISFVHGHDIMLGHFDLRNCWLTANLDLKLVGFPSATFKHPEYWMSFSSETRPWPPFHPLYETERRREPIKPTIATDLVLFGNVICQLMTTYWPGDDPEWKYEDLHPFYVQGKWPEFEAKYLGKVAQKCWKRKYNNAEEVKANIIQVLTAGGFEIEGDCLKGVNPIEMMGPEMRKEYDRLFD